MLQTNDVGRLFAVLQAEYTNRWPHRHDAVPVWQQKLRRFSADEVMAAADRAPEFYPHWPPTVGQFIELIKYQEPRPSTYLPAPQYSDQVAAANRAMFRVLGNVRGGVDQETLKRMIDVKNAHVEDWGERRVMEPMREQLRVELSAVAETRDREQAALEREDERRKFCIRQGVHYTPDGVA